MPMLRTADSSCCSRNKSLRSLTPHHISIYSSATASSSTRTSTDCSRTAAAAYCSAIRQREDSTSMIRRIPISPRMICISARSALNARVPVQPQQRSGSLCNAFRCTLKRVSEPFCQKPGVLLSNSRDSLLPAAYSVSLSNRNLISLPISQEQNRWQLHSSLNDRKKYFRTECTIPLIHYSLPCSMFIQNTQNSFTRRSTPTAK